VLVCLGLGVKMGWSKYESIKSISQLIILLLTFSIILNISNISSAMAQNQPYPIFNPSESIVALNVPYKYEKRVIDLNNLTLLKIGEGNITVKGNIITIGSKNNSTICIVLYRQEEPYYRYIQADFEFLSGNPTEVFVGTWFTLNIKALSSPRKGFVGVYYNGSDNTFMLVKITLAGALTVYDTYYLDQLNKSLTVYVSYGYNYGFSAWINWKHYLEIQRVEPIFMYRNLNSYLGFAICAKADMSIKINNIEYGYSIDGFKDPQILKDIDGNIVKVNGKYLLGFSACKGGIAGAECNPAIFTADNLTDPKTWRFYFIDLIRPYPFHFMVYHKNNIIVFLANWGTNTLEAYIFDMNNKKFIPYKAYAVPLEVAIIRHPISRKIFAIFSWWKTYDTYVYELDEDLNIVKEIFHENRNLEQPDVMVIGNTVYVVHDQLGYSAIYVRELTPDGKLTPSLLYYSDPVSTGPTVAHIDSTWVLIYQHIYNPPSGYYTVGRWVAKMVIVYYPSPTLTTVSTTPTAVPLPTTITTTYTTYVPTTITTERTLTTTQVSTTTVIITTTSIAVSPLLTAVTEISWPITIGVGITLLIVGFVIGYFMRRR